jgi:hypothetical protein
MFPGNKKGRNTNQIHSVKSTLYSFQNAIKMSPEKRIIDQYL